MSGWCVRLVGIVAIAASLVGPAGAQAPVVNAVAYVEVIPSSRDAMVAALGQYRDASRREAGFVAANVLEHLSRRGHFVVVETWRDQAALDAHARAPSTTAFRNALAPIRLSGYDERPYKPLSVAAARGEAGDQTVYVVSHVDVFPDADAPGILTKQAVASRAEPGCVRFDVLQHAKYGNHFTVVEVWRNQQALDAHAAAAHTKQYRETLQPITGSPIDERLYRSIG